MTAKELYLEAMRRTDAREHDAFMAMQATDAHWEVPGAALDGHEQIRPWLEMFWNAFSSYRHDLTRVVEDGGTVFAEGTWTGTHDGPLATPQGEVPPTGRTVTFRWAMSVTIDVEAELGTAVNLYYDQLELFAQLGLVPEPAAA